MATNKEGQFKNEGGNTAKDFNETLDTAANKGTETKDNVKSFLAGKAKNAMEGVGVESMQDLKDRAGEAFQKAKDIASDVGGRVQEGANAAVDTVSTTVRRYPFPAVLVGFG